MPVQVVIQRCERASLLIDNKDEWVDIGKGVIIYLCILKETKSDQIDKIVSNLLNLKMLEGEKPTSIMDLGVDVMVIPQASLAGKIKQKNLQYHCLIDKVEGAKLYAQFCDSMKSCIKGKFQNGTYGNYQGLKFESQGPFTLSMEF